MRREILEQIKKDKYYDYLKENSYLIKDLIRKPENYSKIKEFFKEKYHLRVSDKLSNVIDDIELVSSIMNTIG